MSIGIKVLLGVLALLVVGGAVYFGSLSYYHVEDADLELFTTDLAAAREAAASAGLPLLVKIGAPY